MMRLLKLPDILHWLGPDQRLKGKIIMRKVAAVLAVFSVFFGVVAQAQSSPRLYVFDCGRLSFADVAAFGLTNDDTDVREMIVPCYMIEHAQGRLLWDGGLPSAVAEQDGWVYNDAGGGQKLDRTFAEQLAAMGLGMDAFDYAAFSHMHYDHIGVANEIEGATLIIQQAEYDDAFADEVREIYQPHLYHGLADLDTIFIDGDHDVFGDGTVRIISTPGHTSGHQSLFVDLENSGPVVLSGDLYHFRFSREHRRVPTFNVDRDQTLASMTRVDEVLAETGAVLWIEHDLAKFRDTRHAPAYID